MMRRTGRILDKTTARKLALVFMELYKNGVRHACEADDEGLVREHVEKISRPRMFGYLGEVRESYTYWENRIIDIAEDKNFRKTIIDYFKYLGGYGNSYLSVALVIAKDFYIRGLMDYLKYPFEKRIGTLDKYQYAWWEEKKVRGIDKYHVRTFVQDMCDSHVAEISEGFKDVVTANHYNQFKNAFSLSLVAYI